MNPKIINRGEIIIACTIGDGNKTYEVWQAFENFNKDKPLHNKVFDNGYEIRIYDGEKCTVFTGLSVTDEEADPEYTVLLYTSLHITCISIYLLSLNRNLDS